MFKADPHGISEDPAVVTEAVTAIAEMNAIDAIPKPNVRCGGLRNINTLSF